MDQREWGWMGVAVVVLAMMVGLFLNRLLLDEVRLALGTLPQ